MLEANRYRPSRIRSNRPGAWRHRLVTIAALAVVTALAPGVAGAQDPYPSKPIRLIVGFAAGGPTDVISRVIGGELSKQLGQQIVVENRTGASGNIATEQVVRSPNDGYTLLMGANSNAVNETLFKNLRFKFAKDLSPIALLAMAPTVLVVHPSLGVNSVQDLVKLGKESPDGIFYATAGKGTTTHLAGELFGQQAGIKMIPVPYKGSGETTKDLLAGNIKVMFSPAPPVLAFLKNGQLKGLASTGLSRAGVVPDLPTVAESGIKDFDMRMWFGLMAPAGTPPAIVEKLAKAAEKALQSPTVKDALAKQGFDAIYENPKDYAAFIQKEIDKWGRVVKTIGTIGN